MTLQAKPIVDEFSEPLLKSTPPRLIKIVGITEDRLVFVTGMNGPDDHLVMLGV